MKVIDPKKLTKEQRIAREKRLAYNKAYDARKRAEREGQSVKRVTSKPSTPSPATKRAVSALVPRHANLNYDRLLPLVAEAKDTAAKLAQLENEIAEVLNASK